MRFLLLCRWRAAGADGGSPLKKALAADAAKPQRRAGTLLPAAPPHATPGGKGGRSFLRDGLIFF